MTLEAGVGKGTKEARQTDLRKLVWLPAILLLTAPFVRRSEWPLLGLAIVAAVSILVPVHLTRYRLWTFTSLYCLANFVFFPVAMVANLLLDRPAMHPDLWQHAHLALIGITLGMATFSCGHFTTSALLRRGGKAEASIPYLPGRRINFLLVSSIVLVVLFKIKVGAYFHASIMQQSADAGVFLNILENLQWVALLGVFLQVYRYVQTRKLSDGFQALVLVLIPILLYLPSGSRIQAIGFLPLLCWGFLAWEPRRLQKVLVLGGGLTAIISLMVVMGIYRNIEDVGNAGLKEQYKLLASAEATASVDPTALVIQRLSDCLSAGQIMATTPERYPYRKFEGMGTWWQAAVPGFLRPQENRIDMDEGANTTLKYGISTSPDSSSPVTTIGDLFSRFGYIGIAAGMFLVGCAFSLADSLVTGRNNIRNIVFFILFARTSWIMLWAPIMVNGIVFMRELPVLLILSAIVTRFIIRYADGGEVGPEPARI